jgi:hypothetical protein
MSQSHIALLSFCSGYGRFEIGIHCYCRNCWQPEQQKIIAEKPLEWNEFSPDGAGWGAEV